MPITFEKKVELLKIFPHYYGHPNQNFKLFLDEFNEKSMVFEIKDAEKMELLPALLHGRAAGKLQHLQEPKSSKPAKQWLEISEQLIGIMEKVQKAETSNLMLHQMKQSSTQSVMDYAQEIERLVNDSNVFGEQSNEMMQATSIKQFMRGLQFNIKSVIRRQKYSNFLEVVTAATDAEQQQKICEATTHLNQITIHPGQQYGNNHYGQQQHKQHFGKLNQQHISQQQTFYHGNQRHRFNHQQLQTHQQQKAHQHGKFNHRQNYNHFSQQPRQQHGFSQCNQYQKYHQNNQQQKHSKFNKKSHGQANYTNRATISTSMKDKSKDATPTQSPNHEPMLNID